jgi:hypothetical protein
VLKVWYSCALRLERLRIFFVFIFFKNKWYYLRTTNALLITGDKWQGAAAKLRLLCFFFLGWLNKKIPFLFALVLSVWSTSLRICSLLNVFFFLIVVS